MLPPRLKRQKNFYAVLTILSIQFLLNFCGNVTNQTDITGVWKGESLGNELTFTFRNDLTCELVFKDSSSGNIEKIDGNYELDLTKTPIPLSIRNIPQLSYSIHTIIRFESPDSMRFAMFSPRWRLRQIAFDKSSGFTLKKISDRNNKG